MPVVGVLWLPHIIGRVQELRAEVVELAGEGGDVFALRLGRHEILESRPGYDSFWMIPNRPKWIVLAPS